MDFLQAAKSDDFLENLEAIEDKLRSTGKLTSATGDNEADLSIICEMFKDEDADEAETFILAKITSDNASMEEDDYEQISDYVQEKVFDALENYDDDMLEALSWEGNVAVFVNDKKVY